MTCAVLKGKNSTETLTCSKIIRNEGKMRTFSDIKNSFLRNLPYKNAKGGFSS